MQLLVARIRTFSVYLLLIAPGAMNAQPLELASENTDAEIVDVTVNNVTDTAGHSCCVNFPPPQINLFLQSGNVVIEPALGLPSVPWLSFDPMPLDPNLGFRGESRSTVAGFGQILTILVGEITAEDKIEAEITVGADGGLPSGAPIIFVVDFKPGFKFAFFNAQPASDTFSLDLTAQELGTILIEDKELPPDSGLDLFISIEVGAETDDADWWIVMQDNESVDEHILYFNLGTNAWMPGLLPSHQGPLMSVPEPFKLLEGFVPPSNDFVIVFGVDRKRNGVFDLDAATILGSRYRNGL